MKFTSFLENKENLVSGPGIDLLKTTFHDMFERGAPVVDDFTGFNKVDFGAYTAIVSNPNFHNDSIPVATATRMLAILSRYKNTQISNYEDIKKAVENDIKSNLKMDDHQEIVIHTDAERVWGKIKVYVPGGISKKLMTKISDLIVEKKKLVRVRDNYGAMKYPVFKFFNTDRNQLNTYYIHPEVIDDVVKLISGEMSVAVKVSGSPVSVEDKAPASGKKQLVVIGIQDTRFGKKIAIQLNVPFEQSKSILDSAKSSNLVPRGYSYDGSTRPPKFLIAADSKDLYDSVKGKLLDGGIDVADLDKFVDENKLFSGEGQKEISFEKKPEIKTTKPIISFLDRRNGLDDVMTINVPYREASQDQKAFLKELIQYTFPSYRWDAKSFSYIVSGNFKQYATFGQILKRFGYHVEDLRAILDSKLKNGGVKKTDHEGKVDTDFKDKIDSRLPESKFELYKEQKDGIAFLYGRNHAILGDATGVGKTLTAIAAAELKMQDIGAGSKALVITLKAVQNQWVEEIKNVVGENVDISKDGLTPKRWTVLYYDNFSSGKNLQNVIDSTKNANYSIVIFDELHKLKHQTAKRSQNIEKATINIPYKWGASATISANRPSDVKNQLKIVGHPLGDIQDGKFKRDFAGMVPNGYGGAYVEGSFEDRIRAAEKLNKWLNLSGVYVRRTKEDLREMPNLTIDAASTDIKEEAFHKSLKEKLRGYKDPDLAISELIASREVLANMKVDYTVNKAFETIKNNSDKPANNYAASKVVIFTNFVKSGSEIFEKLSRKLQDLDPKFKVITYLSLTKKAERNKVKEVFTNDPNAKALVMSMKMGGTGISFPNASQNMIINDFDWTPESAEQSEGRIYRINTDHPVNITYTIAKGLDTELFVIVQKKRKLAELIQRYRKEYQEKEVDEETIQKIIDAQKKMQEIDSEINKLIANAASKAMGESVSFKDYLDLFLAIN
jgi:superfamily II DNA or RNA helicase